MKRVIDWVQNLRPLKIFTVFLAGVFLVLAQACNRPTVAAQPPQPGSQPPNLERYDPTKSYPLNKPQGGMNNFSDVDPRAEASEKTAENRAKALSNQARRNIEKKGVDSTEQYTRNFQQGTPLGERVQNLGEDIGSSAEEVRKGVVKGTQRGIENLKDNSQNAGENLSKNVQRGAEETGKNLQRGAEDTGKNLQRRVEDVGNTVNRTLNN